MNSAKNKLYRTGATVELNDFNSDAKNRTENKTILGTL